MANTRKGDAQGAKETRVKRRDDVRKEKMDRICAIILINGRIRARESFERKATKTSPTGNDCVDARCESRTLVERVLVVLCARPRLAPHSQGARKPRLAHKRTS